MTKLQKLENRLKRRQKQLDEGVTKLQKSFDDDTSESIAYKEIEKLKVLLANVRAAAEPVIDS